MPRSYTNAYVRCDLDPHARAHTHTQAGRQAGHALQSMLCRTSIPVILICAVPSLRRALACVPVVAHYGTSSKYIFAVRVRSHAHIHVPIVSPSASFSPPPPVVTQTLPAAQAQTAQAVYTGPSPHAVSPAYTGSPYAVSSPPTSPHAGVAQPPSTPPMGAVPYMMAGLPGQPPVVGYILPYQQVCTLFLQRCKFHCVVVCCLYIMAGLRGQPPLVADMLPYRQVERDGVAAIITSFSPLPCFENTGFRTGSLGCASLPHLDAGGRIRGVKGLRCHIVTQ
eukprot:scaffold47714_cov19-Tisochrysis_lutea.AAC.1